MTTRALPAALLALTAASNAAHADTPIRQIQYDPHAVVRVRGCLGFQLTVVFQDGERIENIALGDAKLWQATPNKRSDLLFLKPAVRSGLTNMMVVTDRRRYAFELSSRRLGPNDRGENVIYGLRFSYPVPLRLADAAPPPPVPPQDVNHAYSYRGSGKDLPTRVFDDGRATYFSFADTSDYPAILALDGKKEVVVNSVMRDGFVVVDSLFDRDEIDLLGRIARADHELVQQSAGRRDGEGGIVRLSVRNTLDDDIYSAIVRCRRIVDTMEKLLEGEVYHYHHKMILKEPRSGGAWEWHQDYGYWYETGCLFPDLASCMIAVDRATRANGCLQVLKGSNRLGRLNHGQIGDQTGADPERWTRCARGARTAWHRGSGPALHTAARWGRQLVPADARGPYGYAGAARDGAQARCQSESRYRQSLQAHAAGSFFRRQFAGD